MATTHQFSTIHTAGILDHLCTAVDLAREMSAGNQRWLNAIDTAWGWLLEQDAVSYDHATHALRVESASEAGKVYIANGDCQCRAFAEHAACWHRAAARLVRRALEARDDAERVALAAELVKEAHEAGCTWYGAREGLVGAHARVGEVMTVAAEWDAAAHAAKAAALSARIGLAQAAAMARAA